MTAYPLQFVLVTSFPCRSRMMIGEFPCRAAIDRLTGFCPSTLTGTIVKTSNPPKPTRNVQFTVHLHLQGGKPAQTAVVYQAGEPRLDHYHTSQFLVGFTRDAGKVHQGVAPESLQEQLTLRRQLPFQVAGYNLSRLGRFYRLRWSDAYYWVRGIIL